MDCHPSCPYAFDFLETDVSGDSPKSRLSKAKDTVRQDIRSGLHLKKFLARYSDCSFLRHPKLYFLILLFSQKILFLSLLLQSFHSTLYFHFISIILILLPFGNLKEIACYNNMAERKVLIKYFPKNFDH